MFGFKLWDEKSNILVQFKFKNREVLTLKMVQNVTQNNYLWNSDQR